MNRFTNTLSETLLAKNQETCDLETLRRLSEKYPFAGAIQLLYAQKLQQADVAGYAAQLQKTLLYYSNPLFIKYLVETDGQEAVPETARPAQLTETEPETVAEVLTEDETDLPDLPQFKFEPI